MLKIARISKSFKKVEALKDVTFEVENGEIFGVVGPDGAGKTTLFNILVTLINPDKGSASINGFNIDKDYKKIREVIGYLPGQFSLYPDLSCYENLDFFATLYGNSIEENYELIQPIWSQLEPFKDRRAGRLSGGMKQKLALCCALVHRPQVLFLDEPTTGVDPVSRREFWSILKEIKKEGITVLVSTPYMDEATLCDRVGLMQNGELLKIGSPENIVAEFSGLLFALRASEMYPLLEKFKNLSGNIHYYPFGQQLHIAVSHEADVGLLYDFVKEIGYGLLDLQQITPSIEDCFIQLMAY
ncbi:MAG: ABC transporter ATP-binding protein [Bacteroidales bacterium]|jgi:ABC-type multidrug transport system ATPase subunit|nr:ABC transporter ATP-binding protein [Bacteroidales bacterium]